MALENYSLLEKMGLGRWGEDGEWIWTLTFSQILAKSDDNEKDAVEEDPKK